MIGMPSQEIRLLSLLDGHPNPRCRFPRSIRLDSPFYFLQVYQPQQGEL